MIMADKTKNCGKGQLTSTDAKELYEAFMRNYEKRQWRRSWETHSRLS